MKEVYIQSKGARLRCFDGRLEHHAPTVVLINGHTRSASDFKMITKTLNQAGYSTLSFDNRGSGATEIEGEFSFADMVADVRTVIDYFECEKVAVLGISMGGLLAQGWFYQVPNQCWAMVLVSTTARVAGIQPDKGWPDQIEFIEEKLARYFAPAFQTRNKLLIKAMAKTILKAIDSREFQKYAQWQKKAIVDVDLRDRAVEIDIPVKIIHGELDQIVPIEEAQNLAKSISMAQLQIFKETGHLLIAERPQELYAEVIDFLNQHKSL